MTAKQAVRRFAAVSAGVTALIASAASLAPAQSDSQIAQRIHQQVAAIAAGDSIAGRREAAVTRLRVMGLEPTLAWFDSPSSVPSGRRGANIVAEIRGRTSETILLGAHYDRVARGRGVIDNAGGVAAVLELAEAFRRDPLGHYTIKIALFDMEENGRVGSRAMVRDSVRVPLPDILLNFDIFGYGNAFWVSAVDAATPLPRAIVDAAQKANLEVNVDSLYPSSDHMSFRKTRTRSYAISLLDRADIEILLGAFRQGSTQLAETPQIFRIMHTDADTLEQLDAAAVARGVQAVESALRALDRARLSNDARR